ncbi:S1C family serine protease [Lactobacillus sp. 3B(2020)]|uniref:S1C family serine protease n=1 Tax=Lactobacillus sp. 3B(2020) TaxID=2695882 RepID=UPI0015DF21CA|nr:trypsin-like peptidase domain-containing protein [Lactobacillus sp. 3B(2020)]QLL69096.1 PDZ domain-containing protein [Lactobacillus sp. 3B(2020)]
MEKNEEDSDLKFDKFWLRVAGVGLVAGLIGGGVSLGVAHTWENWQTSMSTKVPSGSNKSGGATVKKNAATASTQATEAYAKVQNAVVSIITYESTDNSNSFDLFNQGSQSTTTNSLTKASEGSGVIYKKSGNVAYVVTNNHVVSGAKKIKVLLSNGKSVGANLVGKDATTDLAVLKINAANVSTVASFGDSSQVKAGQDVLAVGSPMGTKYANSVTKGIISAPKRTVKASSDAVATTVIQTDAAINSGNSGGPLVNMAGQVIGINSMKLSSDGSGTSVEGIGFSIPSNEVVNVINQLVKNGKISRPSLGISAVSLSRVEPSQLQSVLKLPTNVTKGVVVMETESGGIAAKVGLKQYDVITAINDQKVNNIGELKTQLYKLKSGDTIKIAYYRNGQLKTVTTKVE